MGDHTGPAAQGRDQSVGNDPVMAGSTQGSGPTDYVSDGKD
jgi:hypothetical protein